MDRLRSAILGLGMASSVLAVFPALLSAGGEPDLLVTVPEPRSFDQAKLESIRTDFSIATDSANLTRILPERHAGLDLLTWTRTYGGAYEREVTWPVLVGPTYAEREYVCGYALRLGAGLFDTSGAGKGLERILSRRIEEKLPPTLDVPDVGISIPMPKLSAVDLHIALGTGQLHLSLKIVLVDGTVFDIGFPAIIGVRDGVPTIERIRSEPLKHEFYGPLRDSLVREASSRGAGNGALLAGAGGCAFGPLGCVVGALFGAGAGSSYGEDEARKRIPGEAGRRTAKYVDDALAELALGMDRLTQPWQPNDARPGDTIQLRLGGRPDVATTGITIPLCASLSIAAGKVDSNVVGPSKADASLAATRGQEATPVIELAANEDALNQIVYYLWQSGTLGSATSSSLVLDALSSDLRMAAFEFTGIEPGLPPTVLHTATAKGRLPFSLGDLRLGRLGPRTVVGHGVAALAVVQEGDSIVIRGEFSDVHVNCRQVMPDSTRLTPCLSDLIPFARDAAARHPPSVTLSGGDLIGKLPTMGFQGARIRLSNLKAVTGERAAMLNLAVDARIE